MARMLGRASQMWCPSCNMPPGPDCPVIRDRGKRQQRLIEDRDWRAQAAQDIADDQAAYLEWLLRPLDRPFPQGYWQNLLPHQE